jgi:valyl-tRNA synthetase
MEGSYVPKEAEPKWQTFWEENGIYSFDPYDETREIFSVDTPPPTVSGKMHLGHSFSYSHQDFIVRFHRMLGKNIFYPFGTDDNGVPTERLIEKTKGVKSLEMDRQEFVKLCLATLDAELRPKYLGDWKRIGMSCDWKLFYSTINEHCQKVSQRSFIDLYKKGRVYRKEAPAVWCPECRTGISQQEMVDKELDSTFNDIVFKVDGKELVIATTRPELLPACVAVFYHPSDKRYSGLKGKKAKVPLFGFEVPVIGDARADPEKGTGIVMCCTFGDQTDMEWQKAHNLPIKEAITKDGKMSALAGKYAGMSIKEARKHMISDMKGAQLLISQKPIRHAVNVHERCGTEIEFVHSKQWFIKYLDMKDEMKKWGSEFKWHPAHFVSRYTNWIDGLQWDWLISRQRYFGIPFPVWYCSKCGELVLADESRLPVDPLKSMPEKPCKCGSNAFIGEKDVLDTWATSSLTPTIAAELVKGSPAYKKLFPMSLRPQAHDIITFWLFNTVVKSHLHYEKMPWKNAMISGWALDQKGKKMSKSVGNTVEPQVMIEKYCADALRFWASGSSLGEDITFQEKDFVAGQKTITKLWNASKFAVMHLQDYDGSRAELRVIDRWVLSRLSRLIKFATESFEEYRYSHVKLEVDKFFWQVVCGNYLEIVKDRLYNPAVWGAGQRKSAQYSLYTLLLSVLKMFAPIIPHVTEEIYQSYFIRHDKARSIHVSQWPDYRLIDEGAEKIGDICVQIIEKVRKLKTEKRVSLKVPVKNLRITAPLSKEEFELIRLDVEKTLSAEKIEFSKGDFGVEAEL